MILFVFPWARAKHTKTSRPSRSMTLSNSLNAYKTSECNSYTNEGISISEKVCLPQIEVNLNNIIMSRLASKESKVPQ